MNSSPTLRSALAALVLLAGLASAYQAALHWPGQPVAVALATPAPPAALAAPAAPDTLAQPVASTPPPADPAPAEEAPVITGPHDPRPLFERGRPARRVLRRYVGTVGGQPATALLDWQNPAWPQGRFYLHHGGQEYLLDQLSKLPHNVVQVQDAGAWHLRGRPGATLTGTWRGGPTGRPQAIRLREAYGGAVRLDVQPWRGVAATPSPLAKAKTTAPYPTCSGSLCTWPTRPVCRRPCARCCRPARRGGAGSCSKKAILTAL